MENDIPVCRSEYAKAHYLINRITGEKIAINCKSWRCPVHKKNWLQKWRAVCSWQLEQKPVDRLATLTTAERCNPADLALARQYLFADLRSFYGSIEYFAVLEFTTKTRLPHLHLLLYGCYIEQAHLSGLWFKATHFTGIKPAYIVYVEKPRSQNGSALYALKYAINPDKDNQDIPEDWRGRKVTYSDNFFSKPVAAIWKELLTQWLEKKGISASESGSWYVAKELSELEETFLTECGKVDNNVGGYLLENINLTNEEFYAKLRHKSNFERNFNRIATNSFESTSKASSKPYACYSFVNRNGKKVSFSVKFRPSKPKPIDAKQTSFTVKS
jgi:hypothetical protein